MLDGGICLIFSRVKIVKIVPIDTRVKMLDIISVCSRVKKCAQVSLALVRQVKISSADRRIEKFDTGFVGTRQKG